MWTRKSCLSWWVLGVVLMPWSPLPLSGQALDGRRAVADRLLEVLHAETGVPAFSSAVFLADTVVWTGTAGVMDAESREPVAPDVSFRLASVSKLFTATLALVLSERGHLDLDADIRRYVPGWPDHDGAVLTPRQLAAHTSGINHYASLSESDHDERRHYDDVVETVRFFDFAPLLFEPGSEYSYSSFGYVLLAAAISGVTHRPFPEALRTLLLDPLGLDETTVEDLRYLPSRAVPLYRSIDGIWTPIEPDNQSGFRGATGVRSTARDLVRFASAFLAGDIVSPGLRDEALAPVRLPDGSPAGEDRFSVGFGWRVGLDWAGRRVAHHAGVTPGARAVLLGYRDRRAAVALLSNATWTSRMETTAELIAAPFLEPESSMSDPCPTGEWVYEGRFRDDVETGRLRIRAVDGVCEGVLVSNGGLGARFDNGSADREFRLVRVTAGHGGHVFALAYPWGLAQFRLEPAGDGIEAVGDVVGWPLRFSSSGGGGQ